MPLPSLEKTWQFSVNQQVLFSDATSHLDTCQKFWFKVINSLLGFAQSPWTVVGSGNSTAAGMDGVNRITASTNFVWSISGARTWIVLKQVGVAANFQVCFEFGYNATPVERGVRVIISPSAGFTGGSTTLRPTATDEHVVLSNGQVIPNAVNTTDPFPLALHAMQTTDGSITRLIFYYRQVASTIISFEKPADAVAGWNIPYICATSFSQGGTLTYSTYYTNANAHSSQAGAFSMHMSVEGYAGNAIGNGLNSVPNEFSLEWPITPMGLICPTAPRRGRHGRVVDLWWGSTFHIDGTCYPGDGTRQFVQFGHMIFPWNGTIPVLS